VPKVPVGSKRFNGVEIRPGLGIPHGRRIAEDSGRSPNGLNRLEIHMY